METNSWGALNQRRKVFVVGNNETSQDPTFLNSAFTKTLKTSPWQHDIIPSSDMTIRNRLVETNCILMQRRKSSLYYFFWYYHSIFFNLDRSKWKTKKQSIQSGTTNTLKWNTASRGWNDIINVRSEQWRGVCINPDSCDANCEDKHVRADTDDR